MQHYINTELLHVIIDNIIRHLFCFYIFTSKTLRLFVAEGKSHQRRVSRWRRQNLTTIFMTRPRRQHRVKRSVLNNQNIIEELRI